MSSTLGSIRKYLPTLRKREGSVASSPTTDVPVEENLDEKRGKLDGDSDVDVASKEVTTAVDPDLNPGELTFEEGERTAYCCPSLARLGFLLVPKCMSDSAIIEHHSRSDRGCLSGMVPPESRAYGSV